MSHTRDWEDKYQLKTYKKLALSLVKGEDVWVETEEGERYLDLYGGHAVVATGHCHPKVVEAIQGQVGRMMFYSNFVYNDVRGRAAKRLAEIAPEGLGNVFFINSGAEANENALKLARRHAGKAGILSFEGGFHGRTIGALSATGMPKYREAFGPLVPSHFFLPHGDLEAVEKLMEAEEIGGVLLEPIQSMAGARVASAAFVQGLRALCDRHGAVLIYDEVQTGIGRAGTYFYAPRDGVLPDLISLAKGIGSGIPIGALLVSDAIAQTIGYGDLGTTFGGGPVACAALEATIEVIQEEELLENVKTNSAYLREGLLGIEGVEAVHGLGYLVGVRMQHKASVVQQALLARKIITGGSADAHVLRLLPPLTLKRPEIDQFLGVLAEVLSALEGEQDA